LKDNKQQQQQQQQKQQQHWPQSVLNYPIYILNHKFKLIITFAFYSENYFNLKIETNKIVIQLKETSIVFQNLLHSG
jgi:hypothetical protein